jgi:cysteine-rich repeat protein
MRLAMALVLGAAMAMSSAGCLNESVLLGREGAGTCHGDAQTCQSDSIATGVCGDGIVQPAAGEICDDGGTVSGDGCSATCRIELRPQSVRIDASFGGTCALLKDGRVKCWGSNIEGMLGLGDTLAHGDDPGEMGDNLPAVDLGTGATAVALSTGLIHACALLSDGRVKCWGNNDAGQLGLGDTLDRGNQPNQMGDNLPAIDLGTGATAVALSTNDDSTCALLSDGRVKCWGNNDGNELGLGDADNRGDDPDEMGDTLPFVNLGTGVAAVAITGGGNHTCALLSDGRVKCWGGSLNGQLGLGQWENRGGLPDDMGDNLPAVDLGTGATAVALAADNATSCALMSDGRVKCWGHNGYGNLGLGDTLNRGNQPNQMGDNLPTIDLGTGMTAVAIAVGGVHACAVLNDGRVKCWGENYSGELGLGNPNGRGDHPNEMGDNLPAIDLGTGVTAASIAPGFIHTCALLRDDRVKCWGDWQGLGLGDKNSRGDAPNEMGDNLPAVDL